MPPPYLVWLNGRLTPANAATVPLMDRGFLYGETLFETLRSYGGQLFRFDEHLKRLHEGALLLGFNVEWSDEDLLDALLFRHDAGPVRATMVHGRVVWPFPTAPAP